MDKALIFVNGNLDRLDFAKKLIDKSTYLIGADGGADKIYHLGYKPRAIIGDFDSLQKLPDEIRKIKPENSGTQKVLDGVIYLKYPTKKDFLDTELAIDFAISQGMREIILINTLGDEIDHMMGVVFLLGRDKYTGQKIKLVQANLEAYIVSGKVKILGLPGQKISLMPLFGKVEVASSSGLKYDPAQYEMTMQANSGISNEFTSDAANLKLLDGKFLAVIYT